MRIAQTLGALCSAVMAVTASAASLNASSPTAMSSATFVPLTTVSHASGSVNATVPLATTSTAPTNLVNATTSHTAGVTGGAIPQQMQASMAGLLGFCIMGLVML